MTVDIAGYYGAFKNPYLNTYSREIIQYGNNSLVNHKTGPAKPYSCRKKSKLPLIITSAVSLIALICGGILLKKNSVKIKTYLKSFNPKSYIEKVKELFKNKKPKTEAAKKGEFFRNLFHRKPKITATEPPKVNTKDVFKTKAKARTIQKDGFFKRLFAKEPIPEAPPKVKINIT